MAAKKFLSGIDNTNQKVINLADGTSATDAVTLQQLQAYVRGLSWKQAVVAASTADVTLATALANGQSLDGVSLLTGQRVLLKNQAAAAENGIYVVPASGAASRAADATDAASAPDGVQTLTGSMAVYVERGTVNADTAYVLTTDDPITVGTTTLSYAQLGGGSSYSNGNGLNLSSGVFSIKLPGSSGLVVDGTGLYVDGAIVTKKYAQLVGDGSATSIVVTHGLNTRDVVVALYDATTFTEVETDVAHTSTTTITLNFASAPASGAYRVVVHG